MATGVIFFFWAAGAVITGLLALLTRGQKTYIEESFDWNWGVFQGQHARQRRSHPLRQFNAASTPLGNNRWLSRTNSKTKTWWNARFVAAIGKSGALYRRSHGSNADIATVQARSPKNDFTPGKIEAR
jgi:hypothetical protein